MMSLLQRSGGFWSRVKTDGGIDHDAWTDAVDTGTQVGTCIVDRCGGMLKAEPPETDDPRLTLYPARCLTCGHIVRGRSPRPPKGAAS